MEKIQKIHFSRKYINSHDKEVKKVSLDLKDFSKLTLTNFDIKVKKKIIKFCKKKKE